MGADGFAQIEAADGFAVVELADGRHAGVTHEDAPPHLEGKCFDVAAPVGEVVAETRGSDAWV